MPVAKGQVVSIAYKLTDENGTLIDQAGSDDPLVYLHGYNNLIPGIEEALQDQEDGAEVSCEVLPDKGYGAYDENLDLAVPLDQFPADQHDQLQEGVQFQAPHPETGAAHMFTIHKIADDVVYVSGNHPLAGKNLSFDLEICGIRDASANEIQHGHPHGEGGYHH